MQYNFIITYLIFSFARIAISKTYVKGVLTVEENEIYNSNAIQQLIVQSNVGNIDQIHQIGYNLWEEAFKMENFAQGKLIQILFLNSLHLQSELAHCVCQLIQNEDSYFIKCIDGLKIIKTKIEKVKSAKIYMLSLNLNHQEKCNQLSLDTENNVILLCQEDSFLKIYIISLYRQQIMNQKSIQKFFLSKCQSKFVNYENQLLLIYYDCLNWIILDLYLNPFQTLLDSNLLNNHDPEYVPNLAKDILVCQNIIYLVIQNYYYIYEIQNMQLNFVEKLSPTKNNIITLALDNCKVIAIVTEGDISYPISFNKDLNEIIIKQSIFSQYFSTSEFLILKNQSEIIIILSKLFNQTYNIQESNIQQLSKLSYKSKQVYIPDLFYQIDSISNLIYFYEIKMIKKSLQLTKSYLYLFFDFNFFTNQSNAKIHQYQITYTNLQHYSNLKQIDQHIITTLNKCQSEDHILLDKQINIIPQLVGFKITQQKKQTTQLLNSILIEDEKNYFDVFPYLQSFNIKQIIWEGNLFSANQYSNILFITNDDELMIINQNYEIVYKLKIEQRRIFSLDGKIIIIVNNKNEIVIPFYSSQQVVLQEYKLKAKIEAINQFHQYLILQYQDGEICIFDVMKQTFLYLDESLQNYGIPLCFFKIRSFEVVQYKKFLAIKVHHERLYLYPFEDVTIIQFEALGFGIKIKTISNTQNSFQIYFYQTNELLKEYQYFLENTELVHPLQYQFNGKILVVACILNNEKSIQVFQFNTCVKILAVKQARNFYFLYIKGKLIFCNLQNQWVQFDVFNYNISYKNVPTQSNHFNQYNLSITSIYQKNKFLIEIKNNFKIGILNECHNIINNTHQIVIQDYSQLINIRELFYGPIQSVFTNNETQISISGPFLNLENITNCNQQNKIQYCSQNFDIQYKNHLDYLKLDCILNNSQVIFNLCNIQIVNEIITFGKQVILFDQRLLINMILYDQEEYLHIFQFQQDKYQLHESMLLNIENQNVSFIELLQKNFSQIGNLFMISQDSKIQGQMVFFYIKENEIKFYRFQHKVTDYCFIKNSPEWYLMLNNELLTDNLSKNYYEINIITFQNEEVSLLHTFKFGDDFKNYLQEQMLYIPTQDTEFTIEIYSDTSCQKEDNKIKFSIFSQWTQFSCETEMFLNLNTHNISYQLAKVLRNPLQNFNYLISYVDESLLILKNRYFNNVYLYNLHENNKSQDYFSQQNNLEFQLFKLNTTHHMFLNYDCNCFSIGIVGHKITIQNITQQSYLIAENNISQAQVQIILQKDSETIFYTLSENLIIMIIIAISFGLYFLRRRILKNKKLDNLNSSKIFSKQ